MKIDFIKFNSNWKNVLNAARNTVNKPDINKEPSSEWKRRILLSEHSPIRMINIFWGWSGLKSWVSQHFARHNKYAEHFVSTGRSDRTGIPRDELSQGELVSHRMSTNAQEIIQISRKRLCTGASTETRDAWKLFLKKMSKKEPELASVCVRECVYRGFCPEISKCGYTKTNAFTQELTQYRGEYEKS